MNALFCSLRRNIHRRRAYRRWPWVLVLLAFFVHAGALTLRAQDTEGDNPTGQAGDYNGEVTTGGSYDPYTQNIKRSITDLVVPGSNGAYPLAFSRTYNSQSGPTGGDTAYFGDGGNWRHSYMWTVSPGVSGVGSGNSGPWSVAYPDGAVVSFRPGRATAPSNEISTYWRGPSGTNDRLEIDSSGNPKCLHLSDGGIVTFGGFNGFHAATITDPYGAVTKLDYANVAIQINGIAAQANYLSKITEPGGRWLKFFYNTVTYHGTRVNGGGSTNDYTWVVLDHVQASNGQTVTYQYATFGGNGAELHGGQGETGDGYTSPYYVLTGVNYDAEPSVSSSGCVQASYFYTLSGDAPFLTAAHDPHYEGAMADIRYATNTSLEEQNYFPPYQCVSHLDGTPQQPNNNSSTETRGDRAAGGGAITRTFIFHGNHTEYSDLQWNLYTHSFQPTSSSEQTDAKNAQLTDYTDWEGNPTHLTYYDAGDPNGSHNLRSVTDALGNTTFYGHEPITGKTCAVQLPDGRLRQSLWLDKDLTNPHPENQPYYLWQTIDERGQVTNYTLRPNDGLVYQITYPDNATEQFYYQGFTRDSWVTSYAKIGHQITKLGADIYYTYGSNPNNPNGAYQAADMLTCVERYYDLGTGTKRSEKTYFEYDAFDRLSKTTDPRGVVTTFQYNARHQLTRTTHVADGTYSTRAYDDYGNCTDATDELGHTAHTVYDGYRRPVSVTVPVNDGTYATRTASFAYDPRATDSSSLSPATSHTRAQWSVSWAPSGKGSERIFSPNGWLSYQFDGISASSGGPNGTVSIGSGPGFVYTGATYSSIGQVLTSLDAQGQTSTFTYDSCGRKTSATDPNGHTSSWTYYGANQPSSSTNYAGWLKSVTTPGPDTSVNGGTVTTTTTGYDNMGRVTSTVDPYNHTFQSGYDAAGNLIAQTDGAQPASNPPVTQFQPHDTLYGYDALGRRTSITNSNDSTKKERWTYDLSGNVATYQNYATNTCTYTYDGRNRCTGDSWDDGSTPPTTYTFDAASRVTQVANWHATTQYTYDDAGEVLAEQQLHTDANGAQTTHYTRDADGNVATLTNPSGFYGQYAYDYQGRCTGAYAGSTTLSRYTYSGDWLTGRALANGLCTTYGHQPNGRVTDVWHRHGDLNCTPNGPSVSRHLYGYAPDGQISWFDREADNGSSGSALENGNGDAFAYYPDGTLKLHFRDLHYNGANGSGPYARNNWPVAGDAHGDSQVNVLSPDGTGFSADTAGNSYAYDGAGNRTTANQGTPQQNLTYAYPSAGPIQGDNKYGTVSTHNSANNTTTSATPTYDANFNTTNATVGWTYAYDAENHLSAATGPGGQTASFQYDGAGRLIVQAVGGSVTHFYYAGSQRIEERNASNQVLEAYLFDAPGSDQILLRQGQYGQVWYQYDLMGNTSHLSDGSGNVVEQYLYDAYGQPSVYDRYGTARAGGSLYDNRYLFKGAEAYEWLPQMAAYYCRARFYLPYHGRWLQPDPIGQAGGLNIYTYCDNDPVNGSDPSGLEVDMFRNTMDAAGGRIQGASGDDRDYTFSGGRGGHIHSSFGGAAPDSPSAGTSSGGAGATPQEPAQSTGGGTLGPPNPPATPAAHFNDNRALGSSGMPSSGGVGAPPLIVSVLPVVGSGWSMIHAFQTGHPWQGIFHGVMAASDVLLVKSIVTGFVKGGVLAFGRMGVQEASALERVVARNGGEIVKGGATFGSRRSARQAASELAGDLGSNPRAIRMFEFEQANVPWGLRKSNQVIGRKATTGLKRGWRDDFLGHPQFDAGRHVNAWFGEEEFHLFY